MKNQFSKFKIGSIP